jgi:Predicted hydrolase of the alpha/beta superfamily
MKNPLILIITGLFYFVSYSQNQTTIIQAKPLVIGEVHELQSTILAEKRVVNVYLPDGYKPNDTITYPVVYLLDGGLDEDFIHIVGLYQFNSFPWINRIKPSIVVGIVNTDRRKDMTFPTSDTGDIRRYPTSGHSELFIAFLERELLPFIRKSFRVNSTSTIIGESLGGLLATEILFKRPALFSDYIIVSPSLWWNNGSLIESPAAILQNNLLSDTKVYIGVGKEGLTPGDKPRVMEADANYLAEKIKRSKNEKIKVYFDYLPKENHATIMHQAVFNAIILMNAH